MVLEGRFSSKITHHLHEEFDCTHLIQIAHAHVVNKMADISTKTSSLSLSVLAVSCFKELNFKLYIYKDDVEYVCVGVRSPPEAPYLYYIIKGHTG